MEREIKFRAWDNHLKRMYEVKSLDFETKTAVLKIPRGWTETGFDYVEIMQYTGLKDGAGKLIYEGDILKNHWHNISGDFIGDHWVVKFGYHETSSDYYADTAYGFYCDNGKCDDNECTMDLPCDRDKGIEIIGNIHQTPELIP